jgi:hypothetical protein
MAKANGLAVVSEGTTFVEKGQTLMVQMLDWPEGLGT